jgi:hypothetical protein
MMNELEIITEVASSNTFVVLSAIFALACTACALWLVGQTPTQPALSPSIVRRAL